VVCVLEGGYHLARGLGNSVAEVVKELMTMADRTKVPQQSALLDDNLMSAVRVQAQLERMGYRVKTGATFPT
jgi:spore coat protein CotF